MSNQLNQFIKDPYKPTEFKSETELQEFLKCADPETGYLYFMENFFMIQHPTKGAIHFEPYDYQYNMLEVWHKNRFVISLLSRQMGKTISAAGYLLWYSMFVADSTILVAAHKFAGAQEIMVRVRFAYEHCPNHIKAGITTYNKGSLEFDNGSRIVSTTTTENTGRGMSISLLYLDEFGFARPAIAELLWASLAPTLATGGKAIITSTPNSDEDMFARLWKGANDTTDEFGNTTELGKNGFKAFRADWYEHPERGPSYADEMLASLGEEKFRREILCFGKNETVTIKMSDDTIKKVSLIELEEILNNG